MTGAVTGHPSPSTASPEASPGSGSAGAHVSPGSTFRRDALILLALFLVALLPRLYHARSSFVNFADHNTSMYAIFARNYVERGLIDTRLGQVRNLHDVEPESFRFFAHHAPTISLLTAATFALLSPSELAARALPILLSAASAVLIFLLARRLFGRAWAILPALLFAGSPGAIYYGRMLAHEAFVVFTGLLCLYLWCRHAETGGRGWWRACLAMLAATILMDWPGAYLAPALAVASLACPATRPRWVRLATQAGITAAGTLALVVAHIYLLMGSFEDLKGALSTRILSTARYEFTWEEYLLGIRDSLVYSLTTVGFWMAVAGLAAVVAAAIVALLRRRAGKERPAAVSPGIERKVPPASLALALLILGASHHVIFTNACHFNRHVVYYLLPSMVILIASTPVLLSRLLSLWVPARAAAGSMALVTLLLALWMARLAVPQTYAYFNWISIPGWPLMGQTLHRIVPADGILLSTTDLANPQFLFYLWRATRNRTRDPIHVKRYTTGAYLVRDMNVRIPDEMDAALAPLARSETLNFELYDLENRERAVDVPLPRPADADWELADTEFEDVVRLAMCRFGPRSLEVEPIGPIETYLGVPWTPERAAPRTVHASFVWERLGGDAERIEPVYQLVLTGEDEQWRAALMWPLEPAAANLAPLEAGATARHEIDWLIAEWIPPGEYTLRLLVKERGRAVRRLGPDGAPLPGFWLTIGTIRVRLTGSPRHST